jgi:threonine/homoserine/homoserine lactone efflux protein
MLYASAQTLAAGRKAGWWSALGFHIAGLGHIAAAALGVSALIAVVPPLFTVMKLAGAAYLIRLGIKHLRSAHMPAPPSRPTARARRVLRDGIIAEAMNPKSALFYLAFVPQFTDPAAALPIWAQIAFLGAIVNAMFSVTDAILIETSHAVATRLNSSERFVRSLRRLGGGVLVALGVELLAQAALEDGDVLRFHARGTECSFLPMLPSQRARRTLASASRSVTLRTSARVR